MKRKEYLFFVIFLLAVLLSYGNSLKGEFIWDDKPLIVDNPLVTNPRRAFGVFSAELYEESRTNYYRPLLTLSFILNALISGPDPFGYHLGNILLHAGAGCFLYLFLISTGAGFFIAFMASLFFLVHPLQAQVVTYISGRADSLVSLFLLLSLIFYLRSLRGRVNCLASCLCFLLALLTKETALVFPFVLLGAELWLSFSERPSLKRAGVFFALAGGYAFLRLFFLNFSHGNPFLSKEGFAILDVGLAARFPIFVKTLAIYLGAFFAPVRLHMERLIAYEKFYPAYAAGLVCFLALACFILARARKTGAVDRKRMAFFVFWFFIWLSPQSAFVFPKVMAEHFLYIPSMALCFFLAFFLGLIRHRGAQKIISALLLFYFAFLSWSNNKDWQNELKFFEKTVALSPHSIRARDSLAALYFKEGRYDDAEKEYNRLLELSGESDGRRGRRLIISSTRYNLAILHEKRGDLALAVWGYRAAIALDPGMKQAYNNIGLLYQRLGQNHDAEESFKKAILLDRHFHQAYNNLAGLYASQGRISEAQNLWKVALDLHPGYEIAEKNIALAEEVLKNH